MRFARLTMALETGALILPDSGTIAVFRPRAEDDLSPLPKARLAVIQGFRPDHDALAAMGYATTPTATGPYAAALVCLPRARAEAQALLAQAATLVVPGGIIAVDGQKTDGIDAVHREMRSLLPSVSEALSKAHGKLFTFAAAPLPAAWTDAEHTVEGGFVTRPGVFSADGPDRGSALLAAALPAQLPGRVVDLGAGWGYLARSILARNGVTALDLVEAEVAALDCARLNVTDPRARFHWADATTFVPQGRTDHVVTNPPFHSGRDADPALGIAFLTAAARMLAPTGTLWMVCNRHLPYDRPLRSLFHEMDEVGRDPAFRLIRATRPVRSRA